MPVHVVRRLRAGPKYIHIFFCVRKLRGESQGLRADIHAGRSSSGGGGGGGAET